MSDDKEVTINFVKLVEQYPVLYDGDPNRTGTQTAWQEVAKKLGEDWLTCRDKWKNIRSCYTRYLRSQINDRSPHRRSYYLSRYLHYLQPFCKNSGASNSSVPQDSLWSKIEISDTQFIQDSTIISHADMESNDLDENKGELKMLSGMDDKERKEEERASYKSGRRQWKNKRRMMYASEKPNMNHCIVRKTAEDDADLSFLKSLLPELRSMNSKQKNKFKLSVLNVIQNILYPGE